MDAERSIVEYARCDYCGTQRPVKTMIISEEPYADYYFCDETCRDAEQHDRHVKRLPPLIGNIVTP